VATAACGTFQGQSSPVVFGLVVFDQTIYAACDPVTTDWPAIHAIDATTGKTDTIYDVNDPIVTGQYLVVDNGLWFSNSNYGACSKGQCQPLVQHVRKMDLESKKVTFNIDGWHVFGDGFGYVWAASSNALMKINPDTNKTSQIAWKSGTPEIACGGLWGLKSTFTADNKPIDTTIARVDPDTGVILATYTEPGSVFGLQWGADGCWGIELVPPSGSDASPAASGPTESYRFVKIGQTGIEARSATFTWSIYTGGLLMLDGTFWVQGQTESSAKYLQRLDPVSWQRVGPIWVPEASYWDRPIAAGGAIWVQTDNQLQRLDIPLGAIAP
jgi:hypothetical protein